MRSRAIKVAKKAAKQVLESTYDGVCTVIEHKKVKDAESKLIKFKDIVVLKDQPCHLVFKTVTSTVQSDSAARAEQIIKLLLSPDVVIKAGSKITVIQEGVTTDYACSGEPAVYATHQEIVLRLFERWT